MGQEIIYIVAILLTAIGTLALAYLAFLAIREERRGKMLTLNPVAETTAQGLPPYERKKQFSKIIIFNKGNCAMLLPRTIVECSWAGDVHGLNLDWGDDNALAPNERKVFNVRLPDLPSKKRGYEVKIRTMAFHPVSKRPVGWTHKIELS